uniref:VPS9 domain-containing protein n=1 Tax=Kalanchoe fedtschenkoi TaxID=63787 RepID=A0A7N0SVR1_KALFE
MFFLCSFIVSFSFHATNPVNDSKRFQDFLLTMESAIRDHPLWAGSSEEEVEQALEGLEKYVITKLFLRIFASSTEDVKIDHEITNKINLLQSFLKPEHLDIPSYLHNQSSWLLAEKELQKINASKAPREKLMCILNCCRVINNLLLNASMTENRVIAGADDFLPVLIYITIKANPPQLHSNLKFIQLYRRQSKLISEEAYYFTNLLSAKSFIFDLDAKSLSMDKLEFEERMEAAKASHQAAPVEPNAALISHHLTNIRGPPSYPFMDAQAEELTVRDVETLLSLYKDVVTKYTSLRRAVEKLNIHRPEQIVQKDKIGSTREVESEKVGIERSSAE